MKFDQGAQSSVWELSSCENVPACTPYSHHTLLHSCLQPIQIEVRCSINHWIPPQYPIRSSAGIESFLKPNVFKYCRSFLVLSDVPAAFLGRESPSHRLISALTLLIDWSLWELHLKQGGYMFWLSTNPIQKSTDWQAGENCPLASYSSHHSFDLLIIITMYRIAPTQSSMIKLLGVEDREL